jgi:hypothetical protein
MKSIEVLLKEHRQSKNIIKSNLLTFTGYSGMDVYNISNAFNYQGDKYIFGRVEKRDSEISQVALFKNVSADEYIKVGVTFKDLQDPCITKIDDEFVLGGTKIYFEADKITSWATAFYKGKTLEDLRFFFESPKKMKDVRIFKNEVIHTFTRPQGNEAKLGKIGYCQFSNLNQLDVESIDKAPLLKNNFSDNTWGGVNQIHLLKNGKLGILGHISKMSEGDVRHYYGMTFCFDPKDMEISNLKIVCERKDFPKAEAKRPDLVDVIFPGGLVRNSDGTATIYAGLSDAASGVLVIKDPFIKYEK